MTNPDPIITNDPFTHWVSFTPALSVPCLAYESGRHGLNTGTGFGHTGHHYLRLVYIQSPPPQTLR